MMDAARRLNVLSRHVGDHSVRGSSVSALVVGGVVLDIQAQPHADQQLLRGGSVPGKVTQTPGGVARNIAAAACQLAPGVALASVLGQDTAGEYLLSSLRQLRALDLTNIQQVAGTSTPTVAIVFDNAAEVAACVADVATVEGHMQAGSDLVQHLCTQVVPKAQLLVVECNLPAETVSVLSKAAHQAGVPVFVEPVSVAKATRATHSLRHLDWIKPNAAELQSIADAVCAARGLPLPPRIPREGDAGVSQQALPHTMLHQLALCAAVLLREGCKRVVVSLGGQGAALFVAGKASSSGDRGCKHDGMRVCVAHLPALPTRVVNLSGAGDSMVGGMVAALLSSHGSNSNRQGSQDSAALGKGTGEPGEPGIATLPTDADCAALAAGMAAAKAAVESAGNVPLDLVMNDSVGSDADAMLKGLQRVEFTV